MSSENEITICELTKAKLKYERSILLMVNKALAEFKMETNKQVKGMDILFVENRVIGKSIDYILCEIKIDIDVFG
jgi:hypothetical protein